METPEQILDALRDHPQWNEAERDAAFDRMIQSADLGALEMVAVRRLGSLALNDGDAILRLIEAIGSEDVLTALGQALLVQSDLSADRDWHALSILADAERLGDWPDLAERFAELEEIFEEADSSSIDEWAATMEDDPDGVWVALHGLAMVEPEIRPSIVESLIGLPLNPSLIEFLEVLTDGEDREVGHAARRVLQAANSEVTSREAPPAHTTTIGRCLVSDVDGEGRGKIYLATSRDRGRVAIFQCDVIRGIVSVTAEDLEAHRWVDGQDTGYQPIFDTFAAQTDGVYVADQPELTLGLLAGLIGITGTQPRPEVRAMLEQLLGMPLGPRPFPGAIANFDPSTVPHKSMPGLAARVLNARADWVDRSSLTIELATALVAKSLRSADAGRDSGTYRYLFEHRIAERLETYRRMLYWMAAYWDARASADLAQAAVTLAWQLSDPQHAVAANAFAVELITRSLNAAIATLLGE